MGQLQNKKSSTATLATARFQDFVSTYSWESALASGLIVDMTSWMNSTMGFGKNDFRVHVGVSSRLFNVAVQGCMRLKEGYGNGNERDFLWLAAAALERARREGKDATNFVAVFPWTEEEEEEERGCELRVEYSVSVEGKAVVTIGFPKDFLKL